MDKRVILSIILIMCAAVGMIYMCYMLFFNGSGVAKLNKKISKLQENILNDQDLNFAKDEYVVFISISDGKQKAYVENAKGVTLNKAIE